jgi:hypothetical protein
MNHVDKIIPLSACVTRVYGIAHVLVIVVVVTAAVVNMVAMALMVLTLVMVQITSGGSRRT